MLSTPIGRLRVVGFVEGVSYLILLGIAMPLKYWGGMPTAVRIVGSAHGALFILFFAAVFEVMTKRPWWSASFFCKAFVASLIPFGTFVFDAWLRRIEAEDRAAAAAVGS